MNHARLRTRLCIVRLLVATFISSIVNGVEPLGEVGGNLSGRLSVGSLSLDENTATVTIRSHGQTLLVYNKLSPPVPAGMNPRYRRSGFLHPVNTPSGRTVTATFPADHPHQHGIFSAWVNTAWKNRKIDFWNLAGGTGRVLHERVVSTAVDGDHLVFEVDLLHRSEEEPAIDILRERWKITIWVTDGSYHAFELESVQQALTDSPLFIREYHYGGMAVRGPVEWLKPGEKTQDGSAAVGCSITNDLGSDRIQGNHRHAKWVCMSGMIDGRDASIAVLGEASNFRAPQPVRLHPTKPYFVFSPCVDGEFVIDREHPYRSRYRFVVADTPTASDWFNLQNTMRSESAK